MARSTSWRRSVAREASSPTWSLPMSEKAKDWMSVGRNCVVVVGGDVGDTDVEGDSRSGVSEVR